MNIEHAPSPSETGATNLPFLRPGFDRHPVPFHVMEGIDASLRTWAMESGGVEEQYTTLIGARTLCKAEYPEAFPQLLLAPAAALDPEKRFADGNAGLLEWFLSPAVCYHTYAALAGRVIAEGEAFTARGHCFRNEATGELVPGRRQIEFQMRELVLVGTPGWIEERLAAVPQEIAVLAGSFGMEGVWRPASDPFFLPRARGKAQMQRLLGTKVELCLPCGLAIASINRHGTFFGERFDIRQHEGGAAHTACVAFGLDRWAAHASSM